MRYDRLRSILLASSLCFACSPSNPTSTTSLALTTEGDEQVALHPDLQRLLDDPSTELEEIGDGRFFLSQAGITHNGEPALSLMVRTTASKEALDELEGLSVVSMVGNVAHVYMRPDLLQELVLQPFLTHITLPKIYHTTVDRVVADAGATSLRSPGIGGFQGRTGQGVLVGVIDTGIDLDHPAFLDSSGATRIFKAREYIANPTGGTAFPTTTCDSAQIDAGSCSLIDREGHGTHVAGIAAGNGSASPGGVHVGLAPEAGLIIAKERTDVLADIFILNALQWMGQEADAAGLPIVVNMSFGGHLGAHDGTDMLEEAIDTWLRARPGRSVVIAAGNDGAAPIHAEATVPAGTGNVGSMAFTVGGGASGSPGIVILSGYYSASDVLTLEITSSERLAAAARDGRGLAIVLTGCANTRRRGANLQRYGVAAWAKHAEQRVHRRRGRSGRRSMDG